MQHQIAKGDSIGFNLKAGGSVRLGETSHLYLNGGYYSRAPFIRYVFTNYSNVLSNDRLTNEKVAAIEAGYRFRWRGVSFDVNAYHTQWRDKSLMSSPLLRPDGTEYRAFITGLIQTHEGVEIEWRNHFMGGDWRQLFRKLAVGQRRQRRDYGGERGSLKPSTSIPRD